MLTSSTPATICTDTGQGPRSALLTTSATPMTAEDDCEDPVCSSHDGRSRAKDRPPQDQVTLAPASQAHKQEAGRLRRPASLPHDTDRYFTRNGMMSRATMLITLIIGLMAGPAVSLYGSPTVSPVTAAAWASEPLPP